MRAAIAAVLALAACAADPADAGDAATSDSGPALDDAGDAATADPPLQVGTGRDAFEVLVEDQLVALSVGPQGGGRDMGYHIWTGLRARGFDPVGATITFQILDADTRDVRATQTRVFALEPSGPAYVAYGVAPRIDDCCLAANAPLIIRAELVDRGGNSGEDERRVIAGACLDAGGGNLCP